MPAKRVTVCFATNRQPLIDGATDRIIGFGSDLGPTGGLDVRYGNAQVDVDLAANTAAMVPDSLFVADQQLLFAPGGQPKLGSNTIFDALRNEMQTRRRHGQDARPVGEIAAVSAVSSRAAAL